MDNKSIVEYPIIDDFLNHSYFNLMSEIYSNNNMIELSKQLEEFYEYYLKKITYVLNKIHNVKFSRKYWRIIIGPWLLHYIHVSYDKYLISDLIQKKNIVLNTDYFSENHYYVPLNTYSFFQLVETEKYNLQLLKTFISESNNKKNNSKLIFSVNNFENKESLYKSVLNKAMFYISKMIYKRNLSILYSTNFDKKSLIKIYFKTKFKFVTPFSVKNRIKSELDLQLRCEIQNIIMNYNLKNHAQFIDEKFERIIDACISYDIPLCFIEGYKELDSKAKEIFNITPIKIFTSTATHYDDLFKIWMADMKENRKSILVGMQHGGVYGSAAYTWYEEHEKKINDYYFTWGWEEKSIYSNKIIPMFSQKLINLKSKNQITNQILVVTTNQPKFVFRFPNNPVSHYNYFILFKRFLNNIPKNLKRYLKIRFYPKDFGWNREKLFKEEIMVCDIDDYKRSFYSELLSSKIYICDHPSTTFLEALNLNVPTILFWDPKDHPMRKEAEEYYNDLMNVGILHKTPEDAVNHLIKIIDSVEEWWDDKTTQTIRKKFIERFSYTDNNYSESLRKFINTLDKLEL